MRVMLTRENTDFDWIQSHQIFGNTMLQKRKVRTIFNFFLKIKLLWRFSSEMCFYFKRSNWKHSLDVYTSCRLPTINKKTFNRFNQSSKSNARRNRLEQHLKKQVAKLYIITAVHSPWFANVNIPCTSYLYNFLEIHMFLQEVADFLYSSTYFFLVFLSWLQVTADKFLSFNFTTKIYWLNGKN